ncbi:hypothetical protein DHEL01_v211153 [Diaporthe helianthi]|uniref:Transcription factor Iwr1 domain-containing protein n=1 Tax=Diaporthe helianthi TaxID=158607 RepID=A0A2P5HJL5_DIAHE|nr:hypothetical protein DHEL01_v211153 [Diaporthe helianthi]
MSMPPEIIQVKCLVKKRKAADDDDEGVVDYLRVDGDRKRPRSDAYVYQRRIRGAADKEGSAGRKPTSNLLPTIHASKPGDEKSNADRHNRPQEAKPDTLAQTFPGSQNETLAAPSAPAAAQRVPKSQPATEPRRFHMSRRSLVPSPLFSPGVSTGKRSRYKTPTTVFVERGHKRTRTEDVQMTDVDGLPTAEKLEKDENFEDRTPARKQKLPGSDRKRRDGMHTPLVKRGVPESLQKDQDSDFDELTRSMNEFVMQQIGENLAKIEVRDRKAEAAAARRAGAAASAQPSKFKPKAPAKRYAERHPELAAPNTDTVPSMLTLDDYESHSDEEYVIETYVRVAAESLSKDVDPEKVGLLVFDNEPDVDFFYGEEGDSDDEYPEDDEDENAEDYYAADYPDEEVDSEDEYNRAAYQYRTGNASDLEEYDIALDHQGEDGDEHDKFRARFGALSSAASGGPSSTVYLKNPGSN